MTSLSIICNHKGGPLPLVVICKRTIAENIERYPADRFGSLQDTEWEDIVSYLYKVTAPKFKVDKNNKNLLSDGRKKPVINGDIIKKIEEANPHLIESKLVDKLVWRDCVDARFKKGGPSRPRILNLPFNMQIDRMRKIGENLPLLLEKPSPRKQQQRDVDGDGDGYGEQKTIAGNGNGNHEDEDEVDEVDEEEYYNQVSEKRTALLQSHIRILGGSPMSIRLLSESRIGKAVKKFIKECKRNYKPHYPNVLSISSNGNVASVREEDNPTLLQKLQMLLQSWMDLASQKDNLACTGKGKITSDEQHKEDVQIMLECTQWRELFVGLQQREQILIKTRGAKMRKIRENLEKDRPKMGSVKTKVVKKHGNRTLSNRLIHGSRPNFSAGSSPPRAAGMSKLNKLRHKSMAHGARIAGGPRARTAIGSTSTATKGPAKVSSPLRGSFANSVAASSGIKRKANTFSTGNVHALDNGKAMKLPKHLRRKRR